MLKRKALLAAAALMTLTVSPVLAQGSGSGGDQNINNFVRQSPEGMQPQSNGVPTIVGNRDGQPVIRYEGARPGQPGVEDGRVPNIVGNRDGEPVIRYGNAPTPAEGAASAQRPPMAGSAMGGSARAPMDPAVSAKVGPALTRARAALQRGNYGAAAVSLEQAETSLLNARSDGTTGHAEALSSISAARAAANRRDRRGAMQALDGAMGARG
ncbi:hypothetical protein IBL26_10355 [Roseomonas aerophila]|uniref:Uncharacterized protein n=1 Tax=Teichococcus aerophilus TaxID=1224513 RepID=A0ABR7RM86_9PROT|nr:hypothetical protein [Pseudoroseomonas aerophila]MBC9207237.1 hypothetical protein [Pseudoroseomonas aerophila]